MQRDFCLLLLLAVSCLALAVAANPAVEREFHRIVNSNQCLKQCMEPVQASQLELSVFKRANYSDYFLKLDRICDLITTARHCVDACQIKSNPFGLVSMNAICSQKAKEDAKLLEPCFEAAGAAVHEQCVQVCGDYEQRNDELRDATLSLKPEDREGVQTLYERTNANCGVMKCAARCAADNFNKQCGRLSSGHMAGDLLRDIVERILAHHRLDLQVFGLLEALQKSSQPECNYLHTADVLFDPLKDLLAKQMLAHTQRLSMPPQSAPPTTEQTPQPEANPSRLYVRILKKQLQVLNKQLELMSKQEQRLDEQLPGKRAKLGEESVF